MTIPRRYCFTISLMNKDACIIKTYRSSKPRSTKLLALDIIRYTNRFFFIQTNNDGSWKRGPQRVRMGKITECPLSTITVCLHRLRSSNHYISIRAKKKCHFYRSPKSSYPWIYALSPGSALTRFRSIIFKLCRRERGKEREGEGCPEKKTAHSRRCTLRNN